MLLALAGVVPIASQDVAEPPISLFFDAAGPDDRKARTALDQIAARWRDGYTPLIVDMARFMRRAPRPRPSESPSPLFEDDSGAPENLGAEPRGIDARPVPREALIRTRLLRFLEKQTGKRFDEALNGWREWMWTLPYEPHADYAAFKGLLYGPVDERMRSFFPPGVRATIRLDEIDWGGVAVNGIPPLDRPKVVPASDARYLRDNHLVFGLEVNGEARAYPKRILAWHEMAIDRVGGVELTVVYCTLCGTVIPYESTVDGRPMRFGTSGLLYRSNKLMFDEATGSLWSMLEGRPVVGTLAGSGLELTAREIVTTTWGEWRAAHPETTVLSLDTGHKRDYGEGVAYRDYFANDNLYFRVPKLDTRLKNKAEVLALRVRPRAGGPPEPVAIDVELLKRNPVYHVEIQGRRLVVITSPRGANRAYDLGGRPVLFQSVQAGAEVVDSDGGRWRITEDALVRDDDQSVRLPRLVGHRAFWFGWFAQFPDTQLIK
jgi:hypothetical protein